MLKVKEGFILRKLGEEYIVVTVGEACREFNGIIRMNETGAFYWDLLAAGTTEDELVAKTLAQYDELDEDTARSDLREFLDSVAIAIETV